MSGFDSLTGSSRRSSPSTAGAELKPGMLRQGTSTARARCAKTVRRPFGDPEPYRDVPFGQSLPCKFHSPCGAVARFAAPCVIIGPHTIHDDGEGGRFSDNAVVERPSWGACSVEAAVSELGGTR